ncbi:MAG: hypothetical protein JWR61_4791 [Ferruginibacter sp.]|nr:hypothetical protein [Ferruginibacter sp.]
MKTFQQLVLPLVLALMTVSCMAPKQMASQMKEELKKGRDISSGLFIIKTDGEVVEAKKISYQHRSPLFKSAALVDKAVIADGKKINPGQYEAIQTAKAFKILYFPEDKGEICKGIYINRLRFGKISLYHYESVLPVSHSYQTKHLAQNYVFQKENGRPVPLDYKAFLKAVKDNRTALNKLKELFPSGSIPTDNGKQTLKDLTTVAEIYNHTETDPLNVSL